MNAPAPKDPLSSLLLLGAFAATSIAFIQLDRVINDLTGRIARLEYPADAKTPGAEYVEELVGDIPKKATRPRPVRAVKDQEA